MPADARGHVRKLPSGKWQLRWYDRKGVRHSGGAFPSKSAAWTHYRDVVEPELRGRPVARRDLTYSQLVEMFLERHAIVAKPRTIAELRWRLKQSEEKFGEVPLSELEGMADEIAGYSATISERLRYPLMAAFRQALEAGIRYSYITRNPAKLAGPNPMPTPREIRVYTAEELKAIVAEFGTLEGAAVRFAAATGLRPAEWAAIERRDVDRTRRIVFVRGTKTARSRREVPLTTAALAALDEVPPRIDSRYVFTTSRKCPGLNELGRSTSPTSAVARGGRRSSRQGSRSPRGSMTCARRSSRTHSRTG